MGALTSYQAQVQDLLHDPLGAMWPVSSLPAYINEGRNRVAQDTKALRQVVTNASNPTLVFAQGIEFITPQSFLPPSIGPNLIDVMGISIYVNQQRTKLIQLPYTKLDAQLRQWQSYQQWPTHFARVSPIQICIAPVPNISYQCDWDISVNPAPLLADTDIDQIPAPFTEPVQYYACYKAKLKQQSQGEADMFFKLYQRSLAMCARAYMQFITNPYPTT